MFPVVALAVSVLFEGLQITANIVVGVILVLLGNIFILQTRPKAQPADEEEEAADTTRPLHLAADRVR
jgi:drug/metabolite transporter (DMT)-like permease